MANDEAVLAGEHSLLATMARTPECPDFESVHREAVK
jgi:hypothetical protein